MGAKVPKRKDHRLLGGCGVERGAGWTSEGPVNSWRVGSSENNREEISWGASTSLVQTNRVA